MFCVYVLRSLKDKKLYTGYSFDLGKRIERHNSGKVKATKNRRPFELIYSEDYNTEWEARKRERFLKSWAGRVLLKNNI